MLMIWTMNGIIQHFSNRCTLTSVQGMEMFTSDEDVDDGCSWIRQKSSSKHRDHNKGRNGNMQNYTRTDHIPNKEIKILSMSLAWQIASSRRTSWGKKKSLEVAISCEGTLLIKDFIQKRSWISISTSRLVKYRREISNVQLKETINY